MVFFSMWILIGRSLYGFMAHDTLEDRCIHLSLAHTPVKMESGVRNGIKSIAKHRISRVVL